MLGTALASVLVLATVTGCAAERASQHRLQAGHNAGTASPAGGPVAWAKHETAGPGAPYRDPTSLKLGEIMHGHTGRLVTEAELVDYLAHFRVAYVGETHDSMQDHRIQLAVLQGLHSRARGKLVLGLEMLKRPYQAQADAFVRGEMDEAAFRRVWMESWGDWEGYADLLRFARKEGIRLLALSAETELQAAVRRHGVTDLPPELTARLPEMDLHDPYHRAYLQSIFAAHAGGATHFERFYQVQVLWDETMADSAARVLERAGDGVQLLVFAGVAPGRYGFGIPRRLFRRLPLPYAIVLPVHVEVAEAKRGLRMDVSPPVLPLSAGDFYWAVRYE